MVVPRLVNSYRHRCPRPETHRVLSFLHLEDVQSVVLLDINFLQLFQNRAITRQQVLRVLNSFPHPGLGLVLLSPLLAVLELIRNFEHARNDDQNFVYQVLLRDLSKDPQCRVDNTWVQRLELQNLLQSNRMDLVVLTVEARKARLEPKLRYFRRTCVVLVIKILQKRHRLVDQLVVALVVRTLD